MILDFDGSRGKCLEMSLAEAFKLQEALASAIRRHVMTNSMRSGETLDCPLTDVRDGQLYPSSLTIVVGNDQGR